MESDAVARHAGDEALGSIMSNSPRRRPMGGRSMPRVARGSHTSGSVRYRPSSPSSARRVPKGRMATALVMDAPSEVSTAPRPWMRAAEVPSRGPLTWLATSDNPRKLDGRAEGPSEYEPSESPTGPLQYALC